MLATSLILGNSQGNGGRERPCALCTPLCWFPEHAADTRLRMALIVPKIRSSSAPVRQEYPERQRERGPAGFPYLRMSVRLDVHKSRGQAKAVENFESSMRDMALRVAGI